MRKQWKTIALIITVISSLMVSAGCGNNNGTKNSIGMKTRSYANDGYLGMQNSHPRMPGHHMMSDYNVDNELMAQSIKNLPGVAASNVTFNGAEAYVTVKLKPGLQAREIPTVEQQVATVLRFNFPRYVIHVRSMK
ncbi:hypothetical protein [Cohnella silvisoli]|uniref:Sporulation protein n=1 Tax=Cohnella silvisoli TaxID=2873699 RepID=A0ABV1KRF7_9BACL|nr:hypothetical protein [Cohnella silvisoli]MCD9022385.1 hypothetical protein [Cohnella silvisoli]